MNLTESVVAVKYDIPVYLYYKFYSLVCTAKKMTFATNRSSRIANSKIGGEGTCSYIRVLHN